MFEVVRYVYKMYEDWQNCHLFRHLLDNNRTISEMVNKSSAQRRDSIHRQRRAGCVTANTTLLAKAVDEELTPTRSSTAAATGGARTVVRKFDSIDSI